MENQIENKLVESFIANDKEIAVIQDKISNAIISFKQELEVKTKLDTELRENLKIAMRNSDVRKFENDVLSLTYVAPTTRKSIDTAKLKEEKPELWEEYSKTSDVKDSIRIKINK